MIENHYSYKEWALKPLSKCNETRLYNYQKELLKLTVGAIGKGMTITEWKILLTYILKKDKMKKHAKRIFTVPDIPF